MASLRSSALRLVARPVRPCMLSPQRRWAQVHDVRVLASSRRQLGTLEKYREKLDQKARMEGHETIEDLKAAYSDKIAAERKKDAEAPFIPQAEGTPVSQPNADPDSPFWDSEHPSNGGSIPQAPETPVSQPNADTPASEKQAPPSAGDPHIPQAPETPVSQPHGDQKASGYSKEGIPTLSAFVDLKKAACLTKKDLENVWRLRHAKTPNNICAAIPKNSFLAMEELARKHPQFVLPVPHPEQGAEIHFMQWTFDDATKTSTVLFTQLAEFKNRGEFAQPHTTITHHKDLMDEKSGLVLMQGQVMDGRGMTLENAKFLVMCVQRFYGGWEAEAEELTGERKVRAEERKKLLEWFAAGDAQFSVEKLIEEAEKMG